LKISTEYQSIISYFPYLEMRKFTQNWNTLQLVLLGCNWKLLPNLTSRRLINRPFLRHNLFQYFARSQMAYDNYFSKPNRTCRFHDADRFNYLQDAFVSRVTMNVFFWATIDHIVTEIFYENSCWKTYNNISCVHLTRTRWCHCATAYNIQYAFVWPVRPFLS